MTTYAPTKQGDSLAWELAEWIGYSADTRSICAGLVRNANRLHNLGVAECNGSPWRAQITAKADPAVRAYYGALAARDEARVTEEIERRTARVLSLAHALPFPDETGAPWPVEVEGDPRGAVVALLTPDGRRIVVERGNSLA
jgi:hypothetical protein